MLGRILRAVKLGQVIRHIVWDWNGTLFDDQDLVVATTNASLRAIGVERQTTYAEYRRLYRRPLEAFYQLMLGRAVTAGEWPLLDAAFVDYYDAHRPAYGLHVEAIPAMDAWLPRSQSLLSMFGHDKLTALTAEFGLTGRFRRIDGRPLNELGFESKAKYLSRHLDYLRAEDPSLTPDQVAIVGDCLDDAQAALANGVVAVLYSGGASDRSVLEAAGVPVVDSLIEAVALLAAHGSERSA